MPRRNESLAEKISRAKKTVVARKTSPTLSAEEVKSQVARLTNDLFEKVNELSMEQHVDFDELFDIVAENLEGVHLPAEESDLIQKLAQAALNSPKTWGNGDALQKIVSQKILEYVRRGLSEDADSADLENIWLDVYHGSFEAAEKAGWRFRHPLIKETYAKRLIECEEKTGRSAQSLADEAMLDFVEAYVPAYIGGATKRAKAKRAKA